MTTKKDLHRLVDELPTREVAAARRYLEYLRNMGDPVRRALEEAPLDDEPLTAEDEAAINEAHRDVAAGRVVDHREVKRQLGL